MPFTASCVLSRQGHLENSPPFQRWVTRSPDDHKAPAGAKEAGARRSAIHEHPHDRRLRNPSVRDASRCVADVRVNRKAVRRLVTRESVMDRSFVPSGTSRIVVPTNPAMNRWAIVGCPWRDKDIGHRRSHSSSATTFVAEHVGHRRTCRFDAVHGIVRFVPLGTSRK